MPTKPRPLMERLMEKVEEAPSGCWVFTASLRHGYGQIFVTKRPRLVVAQAHRVSYELHVGPIPAGLVIDHLCRNTACVNPSHLEPVTTQINTARGDAYKNGERFASRTHCPQGHPYDEVNTGRSTNGWRYCRTCKRNQRRAHYARKKAAA